jgi:HK97 family phage major capsid protein
MTINRALADVERELSALDQPHRAGETLRARREWAAQGVRRRVSRLHPDAPHRDSLEDQRALDQAVEDYERATRLAEQVPRILVKAEPEVYRRDGENGALADFVLGSIPSSDPFHVAARERYLRHRRRAEIEGRDVGSSAFASLVVPAFYVELAGDPARIGAPLVEALRDVTYPLPPNGVAGTLPRSTTSGGPVAAAQTADNAGVNEVDPAYVDVTRGNATISDKVDTSLQALERLGPLGQAYLYADLARAVNDNLDDQLINGSGSSGQLLGIRSGTIGSTVTWNQASPTRAQFVGRIARVASDVAGVRRQVPTAAIMHSRRLFWLLGGSVATTTDAAAVGLQVDLNVEPPFSARVAGVGVLADDHLPTNVGTNEDVVLVLRHSDLVLQVEGGADGSPRITVDTQTTANALLCTLTGSRYAWFSGDRYRGSGTGQLTGTGLVNPEAW